MALVSVAFIGLSSLIIISMSDWLFGLLSQGMVERDLALLACLAAWWTAIANVAIDDGTERRGVLVPQLVGWVLFLCVSLPLKMIAVTNLGLYAAPLVGVLAYCALVFPSALFGFRRSMHASEEKTAIGATVRRITLPRRIS